MIIRGPAPDVAIPDLSVPDFVFEHAERWAAKPALIDGPTGRTLSFQEVADASRNLAAGLASRGFSKGEVVASFLPNLPAYAIVFNGVAHAGGINTTANALFTADELAYQLNDAGARFLVTATPLLDRALEAAKQSKVEEVFLIGEPVDGTTPFDDLLRTGAPPPEVTIDPANDLVVLPYSSGTTGLPKGVMLTHRNLVANLVQFEAVQGENNSDTLVGVLPFFHIYGMVCVLLHALHIGATTVTMPRFDLAQFLGLVQQHRISKAHLAPPIILALAKHPMIADYDLSSLRSIMSGAAPLGADVARACAERLGCVVYQGYGLTETSPVTHVNPDDPARAKDGTIGPPIPNTECQLIDLATGDPVGRDQEGELCIRGPQVMHGYLNRPDATAAMIDAEGWLHTGDVAMVDDDGYFRIVDRVKELIKYKGYQVAPAELEAHLNSHPGVVDAAVIPGRDSSGEEIPKAFVVIRDGTDPSDIVAFVAGRVAPYKQIRAIEVVSDIPKSASGKILRRLLVERDRLS